MTDVIHKLRTIRAAALAAVFLFALTSFGILQAADDELPPNNVDNPTPGAPIDPEKLARLAWGPAVTNGLRAACCFEPSKDAYTDGDVVKRRTAFYNSGKEPVIFTIGLGGNDDRPTVVDDKGEKVPFRHNWYSGLVRLKTFRLQPGEAAEVDCMSVAMGPSAKTEHPVDTVITAKPGTTCLAHWTLSLAETKRVENEKGSYIASDFREALTTGDLRFRIIPKDAPSQ